MPAGTSAALPLGRLSDRCDRPLQWRAVDWGLVFCSFSWAL